MAVVEDIPGEAIRNELSWTWTSYGEYLQAVEATHPVINVAGLTAQIARKYRSPRDRSTPGRPHTMTGAR